MICVLLDRVMLEFRVAFCVVQLFTRFAVVFVNASNDRGPALVGWLDDNVVLFRWNFIGVAFCFLRL